MINKVDAEKLTSLLDNEKEITDTDTQQRYSSSFLHLFRYFAAGTDNEGNALHDTPCPAHTDSGFITVIPCATTPGLQVLVCLLYTYLAKAWFSYHTTTNNRTCRRVYGAM